MKEARIADDEKISEKWCKRIREITFLNRIIIGGTIQVHVIQSRSRPGRSRLKNFLYVVPWPSSSA